MSTSYKFRIRKFFSLSALVFFCISTIGYAENDLLDEDKVSDSLILFGNIIKDLTVEKKINERYKLYVRAEQTLSSIAPAITKNQLRPLKKQLHNTFRQLPAPETINDSMDLHLILVDSGNDRFYWSDPVTLDLFTAYLNARNIDPGSLHTMIHANSDSITYNKTMSQYNSISSSKAALLGVSYVVSDDFTKWYCETQRVKYRIPAIDNVMAIRDPKISCWTRSKWNEPDFQKRETWAMFGCQFHTLFLNGEKIGVLPEACYAGVELRITTTVNTGKRIFINQLKSKI